MPANWPYDVRRASVPLLLEAPADHEGVALKVLVLKVSGSHRSIVAPTCSSPSRGRLRSDDAVTHAVPEPGRWRVTIALPAGDADALRMALPGVLPRERYGLTTELRPEGEEGDTGLSVEAIARTRQGAIEVAVEAYERARGLARLPRDTAEVLGVLPPMFSGSVHTLLREEAEHLLDRGQCELAVVRAHTACECLAREAIEAVLRVRLEAPHRQHSAEF